MPLPPTEEFSSMDFKHAISVLRHHIEGASIRIINRDEGHINSALIVLRERLEDRPNPPSIRMLKWPRMCGHEIPLFG